MLTEGKSVGCLGGAQTLASNSEVSTKFCEMAALPPLDGAAWKKPKANVSSMSHPLKRDHSLVNH